MTLTRRTFGIGASGLVLGSIAAPFVGRAGAAGPAIRIGVVNSMSGSLAAYAQEGQPAFDYIVNKINAEGGIKSKGGAKIELVLADDTSQPARTAAEARRLITEEKVQLLTGTILSAQMLALTPVLDELKVPTLSVWAGGAASEYMFTLGYPYDRGYAQTMHDFVVWLRDDSKFKIKTAVMGYSNYEAGQQVNKFLTEKLKASGIDIIGEAPLDMRAQDQTSAMIRIRSLKPDIVVGLVTPRDGILLHQARYNLNYHGSIFCGGTGGYTDLSLWKDLGPEIGKAVLDQQSVRHDRLQPRCEDRFDAEDHCRVARRRETGPDRAGRHSICAGWKGPAAGAGNLRVAPERCAARRLQEGEYSLRRSEPLCGKAERASIRR